MKKILLTVALLSGCATQGIDRKDQNHVIKEFYASITSVKQVQLSSEVKTGIVGGAAIGFLEELDGNHQDMIAGALAGAVIGGFFTALFEGSNEAYEYALYSENEGNFAIIQKEKINQRTGCVKVRIGSKTSILPVLKDKCIP
ncbi:MAG: outer membrane lipoprotein SlyB [Alteromonadaceae bacterium]|jgi:outer membrane lipoprotein SlyB